MPGGGGGMPGGGGGRELIVVVVEDDGGCEQEFASRRNFLWSSVCHAAHVTRRQKLNQFEFRNYKHTTPEG